MTLNPNILNALLSMDAYNRGYDAGINGLGDLGSKLGNMTFLKDSRVLKDQNNQNLDQKAGFYALSYDTNNDGKADIVSYRGTDTPPQIETALNLKDLALLFVNNTVGSLNLAVKLAETKVNLGPDVWNGWFIGAGADQSAQAILAFEFYKDVVGADNVLSADVSTTGHSLGGGLAGLVAGAYRQDATIFDHMPYEESLQDTIKKTINEDAFFYDDIIKKAIYGDLVVPNYGGSPIEISGHRAHIMEEEALASLRRAGFDWVRSGTPEILYDLGSSFIDHQASLPKDDRLTSTQLHSQSLLVMRIFFQDEDLIPGDRPWHLAGKYFWPVLFDTSFAQSIGMDSVAGALQNKGEYDGILRTLLAYSVVNEGENSIATRPFGDTAIRAFYNDANDFGEALKLVGNDSALVEYGTVISEAFVNYAGQLALNNRLNQLNS